jgi:hypothetical protein
LEIALAATFRGRIAAITGQHEVAAGFYATARPVHDELVVQDPKNKIWLLYQQGLQMNQAVLLLDGPDATDAGPLLSATRLKLEAIAAADPAWTTCRRILATSCRHEARLLLSQDDTAGASALLTRARELGEELLKDARADDWARFEFVHACLLSAELARRQGDANLADSFRGRALEIFAGRLDAATDWRLLEPGALALVVAGRAGEARPLVSRLQSFGFVPMDSWTRQQLGLQHPSPISPQP